MVNRSSSPCVGWPWRPSPALTTWMCERFVAERCCAMRCGAPLCPWRTMNMSAFIATRLSIVSSSVSPFAVDDTPMFRLITSAERRLAAISNVVRVRVLFSKKRLNTALPRRSGTFFTSRSAIDTNGTAVSRMRPMTSAGSSSRVSRCCSSPSALSCGLCTCDAPRRLDRQLESTVELALQYDRQIACDRETRADVRCLDRQLAAAAIDQHRELDRIGSPIVEQLVDRGADRTAGIEHIVDQHYAAAGDLEGQRRQPHSAGRRCALYRHYAAAGDLEGQRRRRELGPQPLLRVVVAIERHVDVTDGMLAIQYIGKAFGEPRAARIDADQLGVERDGVAHLVGEPAERELGVR